MVAQSFQNTGSDWTSEGARAYLATCWKEYMGTQYVRGHNDMEFDSGFTGTYVDLMLTDVAGKGSLGRPLTSSQHNGIVSSIFDRMRATVYPRPNEPSGKELLENIMSAADFLEISYNKEPYEIPSAAA